MTLTCHVPSRDSRVWAFGLVCSAIAAVGANLDLFPWLPDQARHAISMAAFIIAAVSGKMASSPGKSRKDHERHAEIDRALKIVRRKR